MFSRSLYALSAVGLVLILAAVSCAGGSGPVVPDGSNAGPDEVRQFLGETVRNGNRVLWGLWQMEVNADHTNVVAVPLRELAFHLNIVGYLEHPPTSLLRITNVSQTPSKTLLVDIQLIHPFAGKPQFTGRDVRGIAILPGIKLFPNTLVLDAEDDWAYLHASRYLLNASGYTTHWNPVMYKTVKYPGIFGYIKTKLGTLNQLSIQGNLHGYRAFWTDPVERVFEANMAATRTYEFDFPPGPLTFTYAVDASWEPPINTPVTDIWDDFPVTANSIEPYQISASIVANTLTKIGGSATVQFDVFDWQDATNFSQVYVEAPDLFYGTIDPGAPIAYPTANSARYEVVVPNTTGHAVTAGGGSDLLVVVEDVENSVYSNEIWNVDLRAYNIFKLPVADVPGFWRDRNGDSSFVNVPLKPPLLSPSSGVNGIPDIAVVSYPQSPYAFYNGDPEIVVFDDTNSRFIVYNRTFTSSFVKSGYPFSTPPSWLLYPQCIDSTTRGWFGVGSSNTTVVTGNYTVENIVNIFDRGGIYGYSWHTGTDDGTPNAYIEKLRDVTAGMGNITGDPIYALFAYQSGAFPTRANVLSVGDPYINPTVPNTFRTWVPLASVPYTPQAIWDGSPILKCGIDTNPVGLPPLWNAFYVVESDPVAGKSEIEGFAISITQDPDPIWNVTNADIQAEFPGAWALDCEVVPSFTKHVVTYGANTAEYNWLCVLMRDSDYYWLAFYDPLNPSPDNPGHDPKRTIYVSNKISIPAGGPEPVALDVDHQYFEVYVLLRDASSVYFASVFEFFY